MDDQIYTDVERVKPSHPGLLIRTFLMKNFALNESDIAQRMRTTRERVAGILAESQPLTLADAKNLKKHFGDAAISLLRLQVARDFFERNERRPTFEEKEKLFQALAW